jgi:hypothetical protein
MINAICTWGEGPDIILTNSGSSYVLYENVTMSGRWRHGESHKGSIELTVDEAQALVNDLLHAIAYWKELETGYAASIELEIDEENL